MMFSFADERDDADVDPFNVNVFELLLLSVSMVIHVVVSFSGSDEVLLM